MNKAMREWVGLAYFVLGGVSMFRLFGYASGGAWTVFFWTGLALCYGDLKRLRLALLLTMIFVGLKVVTLGSTAGGWLNAWTPRDWVEFPLVVLAGVLLAVEIRATRFAESAGDRRRTA